MKKLLLTVFGFSACAIGYSQSTEIFVNNGPKGWYIEHIVEAKEGLFPIGRLYNVHPRHIANFNGLDFNKGLSIGQKINVPLTDTNFNQNVNSGVPVFYKVTNNETLANISVKNKASMSHLRTWNKLNSDNIPSGTNLIIGFIVTDEMPDRVVTISPQGDQPISTTPVEEKKQETVGIKQPAAEIKKEESKLVEEEIKKPDPPIVKPEPVITKQPLEVDQEGTGFFKNNFFHQLVSSPVTKEQTVTSSVFKTSNGWKDAKYYMLINGVEPGTIIKITNPSNNTIIFAKVLYPMDKIRSNQGVDIRISDAAAASLAITETDKFILKLNY